MLRIEPAASQSWNFKLYDDDQLVGSANFAWDTGEPQPLTVAGKQYLVHPLDPANGVFTLRQNGSVLAKTRRAGTFLRPRYVVDHGLKSYELKPAAWLERGFEVIEHTIPIGMVEPADERTRRVLADLPREIPAEVRAFIAGYGMLVWD